MEWRSLIKRRDPFLRFLSGQLGVSYLRSAQLRKNQLLEVGKGQLNAHTFVLSVGSFIVRVAVPYMVQRTLFELLNEQALLHFVDSVENSLRLQAVVADGGALGVASTNLTVETYADGLRHVTLTAFRIFERKVFSLPKLVLFPAIIHQHPVLTTVGLPLALAIDAAKGKASALLTEKIEEHRRTARQLSSKRSRMEAHDAAHSAQIETSDAFSLVRERWSELTLAVQSEERAREMLQGLRNWIGWLYWQDVLQPGTECAVAWLLEKSHIGLADIWLYARVLEDGIDAMLTRSRKEAELARLRSDAARLKELADALDAAQHAKRVTCLRLNDRGDLADQPISSIDEAPLQLKVQCAFKRGHIRLATRDLSLSPGVYALAGANGSGKSSLLTVISACARKGALPSSYELLSPCSVETPSADIVELTQRQWCPLHMPPIRWVARNLHGSPSSHVEAAAKLAIELDFTARKTANPSGDEKSSLMQQWTKEQDDYCATLSGGQRAKLELIRSAFLRPRCPEVLLLDEVFAPLDPVSKALIMRRLKTFCTNSIVIVVYHSDSGRDTLSQPSESSNNHSALCDAGVGNFFDGVLEVEEGTLLPVKPCPKA